MPTTVPAQMRALVLAEFGNLLLEVRPTPVPAPGEVLVRIVATGICGSDLHGYTGENGRRQPGQVMGHETVGVVAALGDGATGHSLGDLVVLNPNLACGTCARCLEGNAHICAKRRVIGVDPAISSAFADYLAAPAVNLVPFAGDVAVGALVEPLAVGYHAALRGGVDAHSRVLVLGGGPIGQAVAIACRRLGAASVLVSEPHPARRTLVAQLGFAVVDPGTDDVHEAAGEIDVTIDAVGVSATLATALAVTAAGGTVVLVGMGAPTVELPAYAISTAERTLVGAFCYAPAHFADTAEWAAGATAELAPLISRTVGPEQAQAAFAGLADGSDSASKILVAFAPDLLR
ncbi:zinc-dependent alcohol dehydrogenase [Occultella kanbiaonis]|uniref:zinc-dependent alcohol dehydrogenase n=1 Tax=Occultella kanbiaonis TaxID=2675754 RepID=UPI001E291619|nr:alcohol dehydrogenase catalytic domain-containing protein [Occultella kanbiaonis]